MSRMKGRDGHIRRLKRLSGREVVEAASKVVYVGADMIRSEVHRSISAGSVSGKGHVASAPGEPPNRDTGALQAGLETVHRGPVEAEVQSNAPHAKPLEFGTSTMAARPSMRPARDKMAPTIQRLFDQEIGKLVKRSGK